MTNPPGRIGPGSCPEAAARHVQSRVGPPVVVRKVLSSTRASARFFVVNLFLSHRKYNGSKEVYRGDLGMLKEMVMRCAMAAAVGVAADKGERIDTYVPVLS